MLIIGACHSLLSIRSHRFPLLSSVGENLHGLLAPVPARGPVVVELARDKTRP
jgi:hypothetical protein